jgi:hypothetical protein
MRTFNVFVDNEYFEVGVDEVGGSPILKYAQQIQLSGGVPAAPAPACRRHRRHRPRTGCSTCRRSRREES